METGRTLWDRLTGANKPIPFESRYPNPFHARIGNTIHLDLLDYRELFYQIAKIEILDRGTGVTMVDYHLSATVFGNSDKKLLVLRTVPRDKAGSSKIDFRILSLALFFECAWDDDSRAGIMAGVNDPQGEFVIDAGEPSERKFWRLQGLKASEGVTVTSLTENDDSSVTEYRMEVWGFSRTTVGEGGVEVNEYLYVQKNAGTGWLEIFIGNEIPPERIIT